MKHPVLARRCGALLAAGVAVATLAAPAHAAGTPGSDNAQVAAARTWLVGQLQSGLLPSAYGPNYGGSADAAMSLTEIGDTADAGTVAQAVATAVGNGDYISGAAFGDAGSTYAGSVAKAAVLAEVTGQDPAHFGGVDLITRLEDQVQPSGRIQDTSTYGDYANVLGQAFAARALTTVGSPKAQQATAFLLTQQCSGGWFRQSFDSTSAGGSPAGTDETCAADPRSAPSVDATATAVLELAPQVDSSTAAARAVGRAESWLVAVQHADGSWTDGGTTGTVNTNSTGLAVRALAATGDHDLAVQNGAVWVRRNQVANVGSCTPYAASAVGAIAHDHASWTGAAAGITPKNGDLYWLPSAQALPALRFLPGTASATGLRVSGPSGYQKAGSTHTYTVRGATPGEPVCVTGGTKPVLVTADAAGVAAAKIVERTGTATRTIKARTAAASATTTTKVLAPKTLGVSVAHAKVKRGGTDGVTVTGLASNESVRVEWRGTTVATGKAGPKGHFWFKLKVGRTLGKGTVAARGQFATRTGAGHITVVR